MFKLEAHAMKFANEGQMGSFAEELAEYKGYGHITLEGVPVAFLMSLKQAKEFIKDRLLRRLENNPQLLEQLLDVLNNDEIVD